MRFVAAFVVAAFCCATVAFATEETRLAAASAVVKELRDVPDKGIPDQLWEKAECVVVIPSVKKAAFVFGGEYGRGVMSCRSGNSWSAPAFMQLAKGSWGAQIGAEQIDLVLLVMNRTGADKLLQNKVSLGADASVAGGPVGRTARAETDAQMKAEILSYSRSQGAFAGIDLAGGVLRPDNDANEETYGKSVKATDIVFGHHAVPAVARGFVRTLSSETRATSGVK